MVKNRTILTVLTVLLWGVGAGCTDLEDAQATAERVRAAEQRLALESETASAVDMEAAQLPTDGFGNELPDPDQGILYK